MDYRLYVLDLNGHILSAADFRAENDAEARQRAIAAATTQRIDLWQGARRIGSFGVPPAAAPTGEIPNPFMRGTVPEDS
jgi:hypothetical protein